MSRHEDQKPRFSRSIKYNAIAAFLVFFSLFTFTSIISDGEVGVSKSFGTIRQTPLSTGWVLDIPVIRSVEIWNVKLQEKKETAKVPSSEGLIVALDTSFLYHVQPESAPEIRTKIGRRYQQILIEPLFRNIIRDTVAGYPVREIYSQKGRQKIAAAAKSELEAKLTGHGIVVVDVLLRDVGLPEQFQQSIEAKLTAEQKVQQKQFELEQARKDAEIEVARAEGAAQAQRIVRSTLSGSYLQYLWIKTLNENPNVIYVATEANLPLFKGAR